MSTSHATQEAALATSAKITAGMTQGGAATAVVGGAAPPITIWGVTLNDIAMIVGIVISVIGLCANLAINWYWKSKDHRLKSERFSADWDERDAPSKRGRRNQDGKIHPRMLVAVLSLSAAGIVGIVSHEGYTDHAVVPTKGDVPTLGFGSTVHEDGSRVKMQDKTDPVRALIKAAAHIEKDERQFRDSLPGVALTQAEYDLYLDFTYQYGINNWRASSMRRHLLAGEYRQACDALLRWRFAAGYDCSTTISGEPNKRCWGVWTRQQERHAKCLAAQS